MKPFALLAASMVIPAVIASAQTPSTTGTTSTSIPFIPLISNGGGSTLTGTTTPGSAWFIDTAKGLVVFCTQTNTGTSTTTSTSGAPTFACSAQAVPTAASSGTSGGGTPATGGSSSGGTPATGGAGTNPMGG